MAKASRSHPAKGWGKVAPKGKFQRRRLKKRCGPRAFLDPKALEYPVMSKYTKDCQPDCRGLLAAKRRAAQYGHKTIERKADRLARRRSCSWTK